jgi:hypothetical protein
MLFDDFGVLHGLALWGKRCPFAAFPDRNKFLRFQRPDFVRVKSKSRS